MKTFPRCAVWAASILSFVAARDANITLVPAATGFKGDNTAFIYGKSPRLVVNDGSAADGGFRVFEFSNGTSFAERVHEKSGRSKIAVPVHAIGSRNVIINIPAPDSLIRVYDAKTGEKLPSNNKKLLGDWSTACTWRTEKSGDNYIFLFGKKKVVQLLVRKLGSRIEVLEVLSLATTLKLSWH